MKFPLSIPPLKSCRIPLLALVLLPLAFSSCEESEIFVLLNPDGSGRVTNKEKILTSEHKITDPKDLRAVGVNTLAEFILRSGGVDEWEKVSYNITPEGDVIVEGTALFPDLSKLKLATTADLPNMITGLKYDKGDKAKNRPASVQLACPIKSFPQQKAPKAIPDEAAIAKELQKSRDTWADAEDYIRPSFGKKSSKVTFHLPGEITSFSNFKKEAKNQLYLKVTAPQMLDVLEKIISDDNLAKDILKTGAKILENEGAPPVKEKTFNKLAFGEEKPIRFEFKPGPRLFDYARALDRAKSKKSLLMKEVQELVEQAKEN